MVAENYRNAFSEVSVILEHLRKEDYDKISDDMIQAIESNKNDDYVFTLEKDIELKDQNLMPETRAILFNLFYDYYADEKQKQIIQDIWRAQNRKEDIEKQGKYSLDVFKSKNNNKIDELLSEDNYSSVNNININTEVNQLVNKKENIFTKIVRKIKKLFIK